MSSWWHHSVENGWRRVSKWWKIFREKIMKSDWKLFFTGGLYNSPGPLVGPSQDLLDSFHEFFFVFFPFLVLIFFCIFPAKILKCGWELFFIRGMSHCLGTVAGSFWDLPDSFQRLLFIIRRIILLIFFGLFRAKMIKLWWTFMFSRWHGPVFYVRLTGWRQALRVSAAESSLMVYGRR